MKLTPCTTLGLLVASAVILAAAPQLASSPPDVAIRRLENPARVASQRVEVILPRLALTPGMVVADIGAGTGVFSRPIAKLVGNTGKVYAVDIEPKLIDDIRERASAEKVTNIVPVLGVPNDPRLPAADVDLAFFNDVLPHIENRGAYLKALAAYMKPGSRAAIVEFDTGDVRPRLRAGRAAHRADRPGRMDARRRIRRRRGVPGPGTLEVDRRLPAPVGAPRIH